jgi:hypothetical protein
VLFITESQGSLSISSRSLPRPLLNSLMHSPIHAHAPTHTRSCPHPCNQALKEVSTKHQVSTSAVAIRWVLDQPCVPAAIIGARNARHIKDLKVGSWEILAQRWTEKIFCVEAAIILACESPHRWNCPAQSLYCEHLCCVSPSKTLTAMCLSASLSQSVFAEGFSLDEEDNLVIDAAYEGAKTHPEHDCFVWERGGAW